jgi:uncharacterized membrane protein YfcA
LNALAGPSGGVLGSFAGGVLGKWLGLDTVFVLVGAAFGLAALVLLVEAASSREGSTEMLERQD